MSIAQAARASSIGTVGVAVARDPRAIAERRVERLADADADILDRVVRAGLQVAGRLHRQVEPAVAGEQVEHVVEEADAGLDASPSPVPSSVRLTCTCGLPRLARRSRRCGSSLLIVADPDLHRLRVELEALGPGERRREPRKRVGVVDPHLREAAAEVLRTEAPRRTAPRRLRRQRVVGAGDVVAEGGPGCDRRRRSPSG